MQWQSCLFWIPSHCTNRPNQVAGEHVSKLHCVAKSIGTPFFGDCGEGRGGVLVFQGLRTPNASRSRLWGYGLVRGFPFLCQHDLTRAHEDNREIHKNGDRGLMSGNLTGLRRVPTSFQEWTRRADWPFRLSGNTAKLDWPARNPDLILKGWRRTARQRRLTSRSKNGPKIPLKHSPYLRPLPRKVEAVFAAKGGDQQPHYKPPD